MDGAQHPNGSLAAAIAAPEPTPLQSLPGPTANGQKTTVTLYNRAQLISSGLLPRLETLINLSFNSQAGRATGGILPSHDRLRYEGQLLEELGHAPDTFVYIIRTADAGELIGTAYASRYEGVEQWPEGPGVERTWERLGVPDDGTEAWELHMMAVHPGYQRQGLADRLMGLVDGKIARRAGAGDEKGLRRLALFISTIKETNEAFYLKRGFKEKYAVAWPKGHLGSERGFTVVHMDREIRVDGEGR